MARYTITEKQNLQSYREPMVRDKDFKSLSFAKAWASRNQKFLGTVLTVEQGLEVVSYKQDGEWVDLIPQKPE